MFPDRGLPDKRVLVLDGGTGSELRRRGVSLPTSCWSAAANLDHRDVIAAIHRDYIAAGADIVTANTFATARFVLAGAGLAAHFDEVNRAAIGAAREAAESAGREVAVAASLSCLPPGFDTHAYPAPEVESRDYAELAACFAELGADLILLEMMQDTVHAARACGAAAASGLPFWAGLSCRRDPHGALVAFDDPHQPFVAIVETVLPFAPAGIAIMHSPTDAVGPAMEALRMLWQGAVGAYAEVPYPEDPEAPEDPCGTSVSAEGYASAASTWLMAGATLIGGCCGTTPAHIAALSALTRG